MDCLHFLGQRSVPRYFDQIAWCERSLSHLGCVPLCLFVGQDAWARAHLPCLPGTHGPAAAQHSCGVVCRPCITGGHAGSSVI